MHSNNELDVSIVPDEDTTMYNFTNFIIQGDSSNTSSTGPTPSYTTLSDPFTFPSSILPTDTDTTHNHNINLDQGPLLPSFPTNGVNSSQPFPAYLNNTAYTGVSPAPMVAQGNTTPSSKSHRLRQAHAHVHLHIHTLYRLSL